MQVETLKLDRNGDVRAGVEVMPNQDLDGSN
jgi:hypothetical protein